MNTGGPALESEVDVAALLGAGALAPSSHNAQPWLLRWRDGAVEVHGDLDRALPVIDPAHRELRLACGAAVANVRLAVRAQGRRAHLQLLPDSEDPWFLARITIGAPLPATPLEKAMAHAIPDRRTDRSPLSSRGVTPRIREEIRRTAQQQHCWAVFVDAPGERRTLRELAVRAHGVQQQDPAFRAEWERWVGTEDTGRGVPRELARPSTRPDGRWRLRDFGAPVDPDGDGAAPEADEPAVLVAATTTDRPLAHLHAGQALEHVLLLATVRGLAASFIAPPVEVAATRGQLRTLLGGALWPQTVLRLGTRSRTVPRPPRRAPDEGS